MPRFAHRKSIVGLLLTSMLLSLIMVVAPIASAQTTFEGTYPDTGSLTFTPIQDITDGKIHVQGSFDSLPQSTRALALYGMSDTEMHQLCGQLVQVGSTVLSQDTLSNGTFDLICEDDAEFLPSFEYFIIITEQSAKNTQEFTIVPIVDAEFGESVLMEPVIKYSSFDKSSNDAAVWKFSFTNSTSGTYNSVTLNLFAPVLAGDNYYPLISAPFAGSGLTAGADTSLFSAIGNSYEKYGMNNPSFVLVFSDDAFSNFGVYQMENPEIDFANKTVSLGAITDDNLVTSTGDFGSKYLGDNTPEASMLITSNLTSYFQDWESWYVYHTQISGNWLEDAYTNFISAPVDIDGIKEVNKDYIEDVVIPMNAITLSLFEDSSIWPNEIGTIISTGKNAFENVSNQFSGNASVLRNSLPGIFDNLRSTSDRMEQLLFDQETAFNIMHWLIPTAYAQTPPDGTIDLETMKGLPPDAPTTSTSVQSSTPPQGGGIRGWFKRQLSSARDSLSFAADETKKAVSGALSNSVEGWKSVAGFAFGGVVGIIFSILNALLTVFIQLTLAVMALVLWIFSTLLTFGDANGIVNDPTISLVWSQIRNLANLLFIILFLYIAVANIVQYEIDNYAIKKLLPKTIFAMIFINFSKLYVWVILSFGDLLEMAIYSLADIGPHGSGVPDTMCDTMTNLGRGIPLISDAAGFILSAGPGMRDGSLVCHFAEILHADTWSSFKNIESAGEWGATNAGMFLMLVFGFFIMIMATVGFASLCVIFLARIVMLWVLTIVSPLYFAAKPIPMLESIANKWKEQFWKYAFMHVQLAFYLTLAVLILKGNIFADVPASTFVIPIGGFLLNDILKLATFLAIVAFATMSAVKSDHVSFITDKMNTWGKSTAGKFAMLTPMGLKLDRTMYDKHGNAMEDDKGNIKKVGRLRALAGTLVPFADKHRKLDIYTMRGLAHGVKDAYENVITKPGEARLKRDSSRFAGTLLGNATKFANIPGVKQALPKVWHESLQAGEYYDRTGTVSGQKERADAIMKGLDNMRIDQLWDGLEHAYHHKNEDQIRAFTQKIAEKGDFDAKKAAIKLHILDESREKELNANPGAKLTGEEYKKLRTNYQKYTYEEHFLQNAEQQNQSNYDANTKKWMPYFAANADRLGELIGEELMKDNLGDPIRLGGAIRFAMDAGKSAEVGMHAVIETGKKRGLISQQQIQWFANISGLHMKAPHTESSGEANLYGDVGGGEENGGQDQLMFALDGEMHSYSDVMGLIEDSAMSIGDAKTPEGKALIASKFVEKVQRDPRTRIMMLQLAKKSKLVRTRLGKILSSTGNMKGLDHDWGAIVMTLGDMSNVAMSSRTGSDGTPTRTKQGYGNDAGEDLVQLAISRKWYKDASEALKDAHAGGDVKLQKKVEKEAKEAEKAFVDSYRRLLTRRAVNIGPEGGEIHKNYWAKITAEDDDEVAPNSRLKLGLFRKLGAQIESEVARRKKAGGVGYKLKLDSGGKFEDAILDLDVDELDEITDDLMKDKDYQTVLDALIDRDKL